jgi:hypothetical protein
VNGVVQRIIPKCLSAEDRAAGVTMFEVAAAAATNADAEAEVADGPFPADYRGWTGYTAANTSDPDGFDSFLGYFSVPNAPAQTPDMLYFFTGLQSVDWIPVVDPMPQDGVFDIIQPVLQYPANIGFGYSIRSWYVTVDIGTVASNEVLVKPGDNIFGNMTRVGKDSWFIDRVSPQNQHTSITVAHPRLAVQPWAYNTLECYGCTQCATYPTVPIKFTKLSLTVRGKPVSVNWLVNPKNSHLKQCNEMPIVLSSSDVNIKFQ